MKKRRIRKKTYDWTTEIAKGNTNKFYKSTDFDILREYVLARDHYTCQFFLGLWDDGISLSHLAHEIVEDRHKFYFRKKKKPVTIERWD